MTPNIRYIKRCDLDEEKWNACIDKAANGLIYAYTFYLDAMCNNWDALVLEDYKAVMPLPWRKKWGFTYVYTPPFIQQLGLFGPTTNLSLVPQFLEKAKQQFSFGDYFINFENKIPIQGRTNFTLQLHKPYTHIYKEYKKDLKNNLKKANQYKLQYQPSKDYGRAIRLYQELYQTKVNNLKNEDYKRLTLLCRVLQENEMICIREVIDSATNLLAIALCLKDNYRLYLIACSTTELGRKRSATHFLLDQLIQEFAGTAYTFDFEGSDLPGVRAFYSNFGSLNQPYFFYHWNQLPWPIRLLK